MTPSQETPSRRVGGLFGDTPTPGHAMAMQTPSKFGETPTPKRS